MALASMLQSLRVRAQDHFDRMRVKKEQESVGKEVQNDDFERYKDQDLSVIIFSLCSLLSASLTLLGLDWVKSNL